MNNECIACNVMHHAQQYFITTTFYMHFSWKCQQHYTWYSGIGARKKRNLFVLPQWNVSVDNDRTHKLLALVHRDISKMESEEKSLEFSDVNPHNDCT